MGAVLLADVSGARLSRRQLLHAGGALFVGFALVGGGSTASAGGDASTPRPLDPTRLGSWIEIRPDNSILIRTGNGDFGQGTIYTAYRQIVAEELYTRPEAITTVVSADTDRTPDGGGTYRLLLGGSPNLRKAAAYTYQALLELAAEKFGVPKAQLVAADGTISASGRRMTYGELVGGRELELTIPVEDRGDMGLVIAGNPPCKPVSAYTVIGKSFDNSATPPKVTARETWIADVRLPDMLHARIVRPATLGSRLISAGAVDKASFPTAQLVVVGNLVAVVSPNEWEAIQAAQQVADATKWTEWKGLPGHEKLLEALQGADWASTPVTLGKGSKPDVDAAMRKAAKTHKATYFLPFQKHAPIGPVVAVADVRRDGSAIIYARSQNPRVLRRQIAEMLGTTPERVVVRCFAGAGHYGRSNAGSAGAEDEAAIVSKRLGRPVRVQWTRAEEMQWSSQSPAAFAEIEIGLDADGRMIAYRGDHHMPSIYDDRAVGAILAGLPTDPAPSVTTPVFYKSTRNMMRDDWNYGRVSDHAQRAYGTPGLGLEQSPIAMGLRGHSMRTPTQFQQNFPREAAISEAAALAGRDPLQFRLDYTDDPRVVGVLERVREASGWSSRPSPGPSAGGKEDVVRGRGVSMLHRAEAYWACVCEVAVTRSTGEVRAKRCTIAVDPGVVINPRQLARQIEGGTVMGLSQALKEELTFDESAITATDWTSYPILTMAELPEIKVALIDRPEVGIYGQGSEAPNALIGSAVAAAVHDATGRFPRRLPMSPPHIKTLLQA